MAFAVGVVLLGLVWERARAEAARRDAEHALAQRNLLQAQEARGRENQAIAEARQPRWEYRVLSIEGGNDAANQAIGKLTADRWEYVGVIPPTSAPDSPFARMLFKRIRQGR